MKQLQATSSDDEYVEITREHQAAELARAADAIGRQQSTTTARLLGMDGREWHRPIYITAGRDVETEDGPVPTTVHRVECTCGWTAGDFWEDSEVEAVNAWLRRHGALRGWGCMYVTAEDFGVHRGDHPAPSDALVDQTGPWS